MVCDAWGRCFWRPNYYGYYGAAAVLRSPILWAGRALMVAPLLRTTLSPLVISKGALWGPFAFARSRVGPFACSRAGAIPKLI